MLVTMMHDFYDALAYLEIYARPTTERQQILERVGASQKKLKALAHHTPLNYQHKFDLVRQNSSAFWGSAEAMEM